MRRLGGRVVLLLAVLAVLVGGCSKGGSGIPGIGGSGLPNVVGQDFPTARETLQAAGYTNITTHYVKGSADIGLERDYEVTTQNPTAGSSVAKDAPVDLGLSFIGTLPT